MKLLFYLSFLFCVSIRLQAVDNLGLPDIRSIGLGGNGITLSSLSNPSIVALSTEKRIYIQYFNKYSLKELGTMGGAFQYPNRLLSAGVDISSFGFDAYRETHFRICLGKRLSERWILGISIQYALLQTELFETSPSRLSTDFGAIFSPVDKLLIGMLIKDLPSFLWNKQSVYIEDFKNYAVQIGFQWKIINSMLIVGTVGTEKESILTGCLGIEYCAFDSFWIRAGLQMAPLLPSLGVGYRLLHFTIDTAITYHPVLGISSGLGLSYSF